MYIYFILCVIIQYYLILFKSSNYWPLWTISVVFYVLLTCSLILDFFSSTCFYSITYIKFILYILCLILPSVFLQIPLTLCKIWAVVLFVDTEMSLHLDPVSWQRKNIYVYILNHLSLHIHTYFACIHLY
jgi:hypothetical protein